MKLSNKPSDLGKIKIINKLLSKDHYNEYKAIMTDFYRIYLALRQSYSELEDLFSNIIKVAKNETKVMLIDFNYDIRKRMNFKKYKIICI